MDVERYERRMPLELREHPVSPPASEWYLWRGHAVHVARAPNPQATARLLAFHGAGGNAGMLWPMLGRLAALGSDVTAIDLPLYGDTVSPRPRAVRYTDWVSLAADFVTDERREDARPIVIVGASMGGMLAYETAQRTGEIAHVVATCLLDPRDPEAIAAASRLPWIERVPTHVLRVIGRAAGSLRVPVRWFAEARRMSPDPALTRACLGDSRGAGASVPLGYLTDFMTFDHWRPESAIGTPITLAHPAADAWTPSRLSMRFLNRIASTTRHVPLENCGHFPVEQPGLSQFLAVVSEALDDAGA